MAVTNLNELIDEHLAKALAASSGRSAETIFGGREHRLRQTLIALAAQSGLAEHSSPGEATLHVLRGNIVLAAESGEWEIAAGELAPIPDELHSVHANEDSVFLLTVSKRQSYVV